MGLTVKEDAKDGGGVGAAASVIAVVGTAIGSLRLWQGLSLTWAWIGLGVGAFAIGVAVVRLVVGRLRDFGDVMSALGALLLGGAAVGGVFAPLVPAVALGVWVLLGTASLVLFDI